MLHTPDINMYHMQMNNIGAKTTINKKHIWYVCIKIIITKYLCASIWEKNKTIHVKWKR